MPDRRGFGVRGAIRRSYRNLREQWSLVDIGGTVRYQWKSEAWKPQWVDVDHWDRVVFGEDGCLWAWSGFPHGKRALIADLNLNAFEPVAAPDWAQKW